jgi:hypothetical protein
MTCAAAAAAVVAFAIAPAAHAQAGDGDSVTGAASVGFGIPGTWGFDLDAHSGPSGEAPTGTITAHSFYFGDGTFAVSCLTVHGNQAAMIGQSVVPPPPGLRPPAVEVVVEDNVPPTPDRMSFGFWDTIFGAPGPPPTTCPIVTAGLEAVRFGDVTVVDAPSLPTSKAQCRDGGWRDFGARFRNQGQCVAFVQRGA